MNPACGTMPAGATKYEFDGQGNRKTATPTSMDSKKGEVVCYRKNDEIHEGGFNPETGEQISKPVPGRRPGS